MGAVFMILGASFVFAPQIVSGVNRLLGGVIRRGKKETAAEKPAEASPAGAESAAAADAEISAPPAPATPNSEVISRLRDAINAAWRDAS
jgi:hypothetical protein